MLNTIQMYTISTSYPVFNYCTSLTCGDYPWKMYVPISLVCACECIFGRARECLFAFKRVRACARGSPVYTRVCLMIVIDDYSGQKPPRYLQLLGQPLWTFHIRGYTHIMWKHEPEHTHAHARVKYVKAKIIFLF